MNKEESQTKRYVSFYLREEFWAGKKPDYSKFGSRYWIVPKFTQLMEEEIVRLSSGDREIIVYRDGLIAYSDEDLNTAGSREGLSFRRVEKYTEILNGLSVIFISFITKGLNIKFHTHFEITHHDIVALTYKNEKLVSSGIPLKSTAANHIQKRYLSLTPANCVDSLDLYIDPYSRAIVSEDILKDTVIKYFNMTNNFDNVRLLARANKAASEFSGASFSDSILASWTPIETHLYHKLKEYMNSADASRFSRKRKDHVMKAFTVSEVIELLEFLNVITRKGYEALNDIRKIRNSIIHNSYTASADEAAKGLELLEQIIQERTGERISLNFGILMNCF